MTPPALDAASYTIEAAFHAIREGERVRLAAGSQVAPHDKLSFTLSVSRPMYVYLINQDDLGVVHVEFPLPSQQLTNPLPAGTHRLPGIRNGEEVFWEVTTAGGREHFMVYASPDRLESLEQLWVALPRAEIGRPVESTPRLTADAIGVLRSVGGLTTGAPAARPSAGGLIGLPPLPDRSETVQGVWAKQITFDNPQK